ncbi:MAG: PLP-dependent aminotransferase family protein [Bacteroidota bacterium]
MADRARPSIIELVLAEPGADPVLPLYLRIRDHIRNLILDEHLAAGDRLPASRVLAGDLGVSRTTIELAYDELVSGGFVERRRGSGTYVVDLLPTRPTPLRRLEGAGVAPQQLSEVGRRLGTIRGFRDDPVLPAGFVACHPNEEAFPVALWNQVLVDRVYDRGRDLLRSVPLLGDPTLRRELADHLARTRRVQCSPERLLILASTQQALGFLSTLLLDAGDTVWMEEPGYLGARAVFQASGTRLVPVPVDAEGLVVADGLAMAPDARLAYVTPSHQYPTGVTLSAERRVELLEWARDADAWIVEDDYDSEFRHVGRPLPPLQSFDRDGRVIYVGTFNKALFPGLRLAYVVLPESLVEVAERGIEVVGGQPSGLVQASAAAFLELGHFAAHLRRTRELYRTRRDVLLASVEEHLEGVVELGPSETGLHVCARLADGVSDRELSERAGQAGLHVPPLSPCYLVAERSASGMILGYAGVDERGLQRGLRQLASVVSGA